MAMSLFHAWKIAYLNLAQTPATPHPSHSFGIAIPGLLFLFCLGALVIGLGKLLARDEGRKIAKIVVMLPLMIVGALFLSGVVLLVTYHFSESAPGQPGRGRAGEPAVAAKGHVATPDPSIAMAPNPVADGPLQKADGNALSAVGKFFESLNKAFAHAVRSTFIPNAPFEAASPPDPLSGLSAASAKRPAWVDSPPSITANAYEVAVKAGPWKTPIECQQALDEEIAAAVDRYVAWRIGEDACEQVTLPADYARQHLVKDQWLEKINTSLGEMYNLHALLAFDRQVEGKLRDTWNETVAKARLVLAAVVLAGAVLLLSVVYGYLKIDLVTGGAYRRRLRLAAAAVLALVAVGAAFALS